MALYGVPRRPDPRPARSHSFVAIAVERTFPYVNVYNGAVTANGTDGTKVTADNPVKSSGTLTAGTNTEGTAVLCAVRCEAGLQSASLTITPVGTSAGKWALAPDSSGSPGTFGAYGAALTLTNVLDVNTLFWAKAKVTSDESAAATDLTTVLSVPQTVVGR